MRIVPRLYAHRGASAERPENTIMAFERALELGADAMETDVHLTSDGHVVVSHDPSLERMSGVAMSIGRATLAEVRGCDVGRGFVDRDGGRPYAGRGVRVPTLEELLEAFPEVRFNVDAKRHDSAMVRALLAVVRRERAEHRVLIGSLSAKVLREVRAAGYAGETGLAGSEVAALYALPSRVLRAVGVAGSAAQVPRGVGPVRLDTPGFVSRCHGLSLRVDYWTINDPAEAERLLALGADGIMTDDLAAVGPAVRRARDAPARR